MTQLRSFVQSKQQQRWLWQAVNYVTEEVLAYVLGTREDKAFLELQALLQPFGIRHFYTDGWKTYERHIDESQHTVGKRYTQMIERKHLTYRTRIKRWHGRQFVFRSSQLMHDMLIGLFINRFEFGYSI